MYEPIAGVLVIVCGEGPFAISASFSVTRMFPGVERVAVMVAVVPASMVWSASAPLMVSVRVGVAGFTVSVNGVVVAEE